MKSHTTEVAVKDWVTEANLEQPSSVVTFLFDGYRFLRSAALHAVTPDGDGGFHNVAISFKSSLQF